MAAIVLFTLPEFLPIIGGDITLEAVLYGLVIGLGFFALILVFSTFNSAVGPQTLLRLIPGFAYQAGVALTVAISFIPETLIAWREIREAQRLRGYRVRKLRDLQPLFVSLLGIGLDRAIQLSESMDARGFGGNLSAAGRNERWLAGAGTVLGLLLLLAGLLTRSFGFRPEWLGLALLAGGAIILVITFRRQGQRLQRTNYRRWFWRPRDTVVFSTMAVMLAALIALSVFFPRQLFYYPYPPYPILPDFNPFLGLLFAMPLVPALLLPAASRGEARPRPKGSPSRRPPTGRPQGCAPTDLRSPTSDLCSMIHFSHFSYQYPDAATPVLRDISLELPEGAFVLVVGPSGAGKSTFLRSINGLVPHFYGGKVSGSVRVDGRDPVAKTPRGMSDLVGMVFQDPESGFVVDVVEDELAFALENWAYPRDVMRKRVEEALDQLQIAHLRDRPVSDSIGWGETTGRHRQRPHPASQHPGAG